MLLQPSTCARTIVWAPCSNTASCHPAAWLQSDVGAAQVNVSVAIHKILGVDLYAGTMQLVVWMRLMWFDPRLTWDKDEWVRGCPVDVCMPAREQPRRPV